jgi:hypothetical protein
MSSGPQTWRMVLAKETGTTSASFSTSTAPWTATNIGELAAATERRFSFKLNQPQTVSFNLPLTDNLADDIVTLTNDSTSIPIIKLYRNATLMMVCEIVSAEISSQGQVATLAVVATETMWNRLTKRMIVPSKDPTGYRINSTADRTTEVMTQLTRINQESNNLLTGTAIGSTFTDKAANLANWSSTSLLWGGGANSFSRSELWTGHTTGSLLLTGTKDNTATQRFLIASTPGSGSNMIPVIPGTVYALKLETAASSLGNITASGGVYIQINWYQNTTGTASAIVSASGSAAQTVTQTEATLYGAVAAPTDALYAAISFIITTSTALDAVGYYFDNVNFGPAPQTGIVAGADADFTGDIFAGGPWYYKPYMEFVQEAGLTVGGFDFWQAPLDPVTNNGNSGTLTVGLASGAWGTARSYKGQVRNDVIFEYGSGKHNVSEYRFALSGDGLINTAYALPPGFPSGGEGTVNKTDSTGTTRQRLREEVVSSDLQTKEARQQIVNAHTSIRKQYKRVLAFTPQVEDGERTPRFGVDYVVGDWIKARVQDYNSLLIDSTVRVYGADVELDNQGLVRTNLTLVQEV